jgi:hypothetical protein
LDLKQKSPHISSLYLSTKTPSGLSLGNSEPPKSGSGASDPSLP